MDLMPMGNLVLLVPETKSEQQTESGIVLPQTYHNPSLVGRVVAVGPGLRNAEYERLPMEVKVGDRVIFLRYTAYEKKDEEGNTFCLCPEDDILGKISEDTVVE